MSVILVATFAFCGGLVSLKMLWENAEAIESHRFPVFWLFFALNEPIPLFLVALMALISLRPPRGLILLAARGVTLLRRFLVAKSAPWVIATVILFGTWTGTFLVCLNHPLSMDEYTMDYQAQIFASGQLDQPVAAPWRAAADLVRPLFADYGPESHTWYSVYLPVYSGFRAIFHLLSVPSLMNPLLAAWSIVLLAGTLRHLWPDQPFISNGGALFLAVSSQFAVTAMTAFPLTAHLFCNLLWLYCFTKSERNLWLWCPWIGAAALGLHEPVMHALFVAPFLVYILFTRRWWQTAYFAVIYGAASAGWYWWLKVWCADRLATSPLKFAFSGMFNIQGANTELIVSWLAIFVPVLAIYALTRRAFFSPTIVLATIGCGLTWAFYWLFPDNQGHGWGYRYFFPVLGNFVLLACAGLRSFEQDFGRRRLELLMTMSLFTSLGLLALRSWQLRSNTSRYLAVSRYLEAIPADVVVVDGSIPYSVDFVRNRPNLMNRPVLMATPIPAAVWQNLIQRQRVRVVTAREVAPLGY